MRICHISDLHFGRHHVDLADGLAADLNAQAPQLVVASGDFTQLGLEEEFREARRFLDALEAPAFAVPATTTCRSETSSRGSSIRMGSIAAT